MQVGRSKCSGCLCCAGELVDLALVDGGDECCPFAPRVFGGVYFAGLPAKVAPRFAGALVGADMVC